MTPTLLALLMSAPAQASGYYYSDSGIVATGRGGAWVAGADTQFAQRYNPAGLIRIDKPTFNIGWSGVTQNTRWRQQGRCADQLVSSAPASCFSDPEDIGTLDPNGTFFYEEAKNQAPPFNVPQLGFATPVGEDFAFAFGFISPYAPSSEWDPEGPQRYAIVDSAVYQFGFGPSAAWRPIPQVTLGAGLQWSYLQVGRSLDLTMNGLDDPGGDIFVNARAVDLFTATWNLGVLIEPTNDFTLGLSITPPATYRSRGTLDIDFAGNSLESEFSPTRYLDDDVSLTIELPLELKAGVAIRPVSKLEVEVAWVWQQWSSLDEILIEDVDLTVGFTEDSLLESFIPEEDRQITGPFEFPAGLRDAGSYRLGAEYRFTPEFEGRVGGFYEPAAVPPEMVTVSLVDTSKVQVGGGGSVWIPNTGLRFDAAFAWIFFQDLAIRNSLVRQTNAEVFPTCADGQTPMPMQCVQPAVIGNGDVSSSGWMVGLQAQYSFGQGAL